MADTVVVRLGLTADDATYAWLAQPRRMPLVALDKHRGAHAATL